MSGRSPKPLAGKNVPIMPARSVGKSVSKINKTDSSNMMNDRRKYEKYAHT